MWRERAMIVVASVAALVVIGAPEVVTDADALTTVVDVGFLTGSATALWALIRAIGRTAGRDRLAWSLLLAGGVLGSLGDVVSGPTGGSSARVLAGSALMALCGWGATLLIRSVRWHRATVIRTVIDGLWVAVVLAPVWWVGLVDPILARRDELSSTTSATLLVLTTLGVVFVADLVASSARLGSEGRFAMAGLITAGLAYVASGHLLVRAELDGVAPEMAGSIAAAALVPVIATVVTRRPDLSQQVHEVTHLGQRSFWIITTAPLTIAVAVSAMSGGGGLVWTAASLLMLAVRAGAIVREHDQLLASMAVRSRRDPLTGLANRSELDHLHLDGGAIGACFVDLDGFKSVNDRHGHRVGDEVLQITARRLGRCHDPGDLLVRLGGDEFALILLDADLDRTRVVAERAHDSLCDPFRSGTAVIEIGASVGVAFRSAVRTRSDLDALLHRADVTMYDAKRDGGGVSSGTAPDGTPATDATAHSTTS